MSSETRIELEEEMKMDEERLMKKISDDPSLKDISMPTDARDIIWKEIRICEAKEAEAEELIRLGRIYKKKQKSKKYLVLAAVMVFVLAFGMTSIGGAEKIFEMAKIYTLGREQTRVNSEEDVVGADDLSEDKIYEEINEKYGFYPVRLDYLPEEIGFQEAIIGDAIQGINIIYGKENRANIIFIIRPNYRTGSLGTDIEDEKIGEYTIIVKDIAITVKQYEIEGTLESKWSAEFEYNDVQYFIRILGMEKETVEEILTNLYFPNSV